MAHRTDTGAAMPYWPTPDPVDPDALADPGIDPATSNNIWTAAARREARAARLRTIVRRVAFWAGLLAVFAGLYFSLRPAGAQASGPPWWLTPQRCSDTGVSLRTAESQQLRLLYWAKLGQGQVGQIWASYGGDIRVPQQWFVVMQTNAGLTCQIARGKGVPVWLVEIGGLGA